jgi:hypothetical protein
MGMEGDTLMNRTLRGGTLLSLLLALAAGVAVGQTPETAPVIDSKVEEIMAAWDATAGEREIYRFDIIDTVEEVLETGQKVEYSHRRTGMVRRPDRLRIESRGDVVNRDIWFDGTTVTLFDEEFNVYGRIEAPGTIEEMMETLIDRFGVTTPLADLLSHRTREVMRAELQTARHLGPGIVGDHECDHLAFTGENIDWQIWVDSGEKTLLRKLVITYKSLEGQPEYELLMLNMTPLPEIPDEEFAFVPPQGADEIEILVLVDEETDEDAETN